MTTEQGTPLAPITPPAPAPRVRISTAIARFIVRALCDDKGQPDTVLIVIYPWLAFAAAFFWHAIHAPAPSSEVGAIAVTSVQLVTLGLVLWAAALKLGAGVFVPLAEAVAGAFRMVPSAAGKLISSVRSYAGGPDRTVGVTEPGGELARPPAPSAARLPAMDVDRSGMDQEP